MWQEAALPSCHPSWQRMCSSAACTGQAHLPVVGMSWGAGTSFLKVKSASSLGDLDPHIIHGCLDPHMSVPKRHLYWFHPCAQHINRHRNKLYKDHAVCDICSNGLHVCHESLMHLVICGHFYYTFAKLAELIYHTTLETYILSTRICFLRVTMVSQTHMEVFVDIAMLLAHQLWHIFDMAHHS